MFRKRYDLEKSSDSGLMHLFTAKTFAAGSLLLPAKAGAGAR